MERRSLRPKILKKSAVIFNKNLFSGEDDLKIDGMLDEQKFKKRGNQYDRGAGFKNRSLS